MTPEQSAALIERLREFADPDGRIALPMVDETGRQVGVSHRMPEGLTQVEVHVDENGTVWTPPTAWAYFVVCRARDQTSLTSKAGTDEVVEAMARAMAASGYRGGDEPAQAFYRRLARAAIAALNTTKDQSDGLSVEGEGL